jgi:hypothetical protein
MECVAQGRLAFTAGRLLLDYSRLLPPKTRPRLGAKEVQGRTVPGHGTKHGPMMITGMWRWWFQPKGAAWLGQPHKVGDSTGNLRECPC